MIHICWERSANGGRGPSKSNENSSFARAAGHKDHIESPECSLWPDGATVLISYVDCCGVLYVGWT